MVPSVTPLSTHYALVIDAGSSGSRLQIYSWRDPDLERAEILQEVKQAKKGRGGRKWWFKGAEQWFGKGKGKSRELVMEQSALRRLVRVGKGVEGDAWVKRVEPGISTVSPEDVPTYLAPLLSHALQHIPPSQHSTTPIYVLATAGMRLLSPDARNAILEATCRTLQSSYPFDAGGPSCSQNVRVISGEEEGVWGWVAVNYLMDGFGHAPEPTHTTGASESKSSGLLPLAPLAEPPPASSSDSVTPVDVAHQSPTFGFLDMGGASTQLAFSPSDLELSRSGFPRDELWKVSLRLLSGEDVEWPVFVASWLGKGTNQVRDRYLEGLHNSWRESQTETVSTDLTTPISDHCLPKGLTLPPTDGSHPPLIGTGSFSECLAALRPLLEHSLPCPTPHCLFGGVPTPHIDFKSEDQRGFIGISEYWYTAQQVLGLGGVWDWGEWEKGMSDFCGRDWKSIEKQVEDDKGWQGAEVELSRLEIQCFKGAWISNVLHEGIGIPRLVDDGGNETLTGGDVGDTNTEAERRAREKGLSEPNLQKQSKHHFQSMDEVGETAISWTLGKMVIEASKAVHPRSHALEAAWTSRLPQLAFASIDQRLSDLGIQTMWAYGFFTFALLACLFSILRRRLRWTWSFFPSPKSGKRRLSIAGDAPFPSRPGWSWPWARERVDSFSVLEEGIDLTPMKPSARFPVGRLRLWSMRIGSILKRNMPFNPHERPSRGMVRHSSMPLMPSSYSNNGTNGWGSRPPSPSRNQFFTPGYSLSGAAQSQEIRHGASASGISVSGSVTPVANSPPRSKGSVSRPSRSRQNSNGYGSSHAALGSLTVPEPSGWNDPPTTMLNGNAPMTDGLDSSTGEGMLTPSANGRTGLEPRSRPMSRQSSRVNLSELGLAQRSTSRSATPLGD